MSYQDYWLWSIAASECDSLDDPNCENFGTGAVYYGEEYPYENFDYAEPIPHPFDTREYEEDYIPEDPLPEPESWPDLDPVTMDSNEASKIFFTCTFDLAPGVSTWIIFIKVIHDTYLKYLSPIFWILYKGILFYFCMVCRKLLTLTYLLTYWLSL